MKPRNFPARRLARQYRAQGKAFAPGDFEAARAIRTKKNREGKGRLS